MNEQNNDRYLGEPTSIHSYRTEFQVECPKCSNSAFVNLKSPHFLNGGTLRCTNCHHSEKTQDLVRYNLIVKRNCDNCGKQFEKCIPSAKQKHSKLTIECPNCGITRTFEPRNEKIWFQYENKGFASDPIFNLPLWFQTNVKGNFFWAYNRQHLNDIKLYVESRLRERQTTEFTTMVERLPNFVKEGKNREPILKAIIKLLKK